MDRREFIWSAAALGAVSGLSGCLTSVGDGRRVLLGACRGPDDVALMKSVGYDFWEWTVPEAFDPSKDDEWWKRQRDRLAALPLPLRSCNSFIPWTFRLTGPKADPEPALAYAETVLRRADEAGVEMIVFGSGGARNVPGDYTSGERPDIEKGERQFVGFCRTLCERVADLETVKVVIEPLCPNESNIVNFVWQGARICEEVASPRLALLADFYHMMRGGEDAASILRSGGLLRHCHVADFGTRLYPGADPRVTDRLRPYFSALRAIGYAGGVSCECGWDDGKGLAKGLETALATMRSCLGI